MIEFRLHFFWQEYYISDVSFSVHHIRKYIMSIWPFTSDVKFGKLAQVKSTMFIHCQDSIFAFVTKDFAGRYFDTI